jgi:hypothetical protein
MLLINATAVTRPTMRQRVSPLLFHSLLKAMRITEIKFIRIPLAY